ncbi:MAG: septation protein SpoVG family protein [Candidatus Omnitrophota bacterium]
MQITEVRIFLRESPDKKLKAYATVTFDDSFVVRDIKVIEGNKGLFVAMPSRRLRNSCSRCGHRNVVSSKYCNKCGGQLEVIERRDSMVGQEHDNEHRDIAHPIKQEFRNYLQQKVLDAYQIEESKGGEEKSGSSESMNIDFEEHQPE